MGIEPTSPAWKAGALPLCYARATRRQSSRPHRQRQPRMLSGSSLRCHLLQLDGLRRKREVQSRGVEALLDLQVDLLHRLQKNLEVGGLAPIHDENVQRMRAVVFPTHDEVVGH